MNYNNYQLAIELLFKIKVKSLKIKPDFQYIEDKDRIIGIEYFYPILIVNDEILTKECTIKVCRYLRMDYPMIRWIDEKSN